MQSKLYIILLSTLSTTLLSGMEVVKFDPEVPEVRKKKAQAIFDEKYKDQLDNGGKLTILAPEDRPNTEEGEVFSQSYVNRWAFDALGNHWFDLEIADRDGVRQRNYPKVPEHATYCDFEKFEAGQRIVVRNIPEFLANFAAYLSGVKHEDIKPVVLISVGDYKTKMRDMYIDTVLKNSRLMRAIHHWYGIHPTERCVTDVEFSKIFTSLPLGPWQIWARYARREEMKKLFEGIRKYATKDTLFVWNAGPFNEERRKAADHFKKLEWAIWRTGGVPLENCLLENAKCVGVGDTEGWGVDCYRAVETALTGSFIVRKKDVGLAEQYERVGIPVLWIDEEDGTGWYEKVTPELLIEFSNELVKKEINLEKLFMNFWNEVIEKSSKEARLKYLKSRLDSPLGMAVKSEEDLLKYIKAMQGK